MKLHLINGPNLNLLGRREPEIYGPENMDQVLEKLRVKYPTIEMGYFQSNVEGEIINEIQRVMGIVDGIIINPGGYSHTSVAIADALRAIKIPALEVHLSNIHSREPFRHHSLTGAACKGIITGLGTAGYSLAVQWFLQSR